MIQGIVGVIIWTDNVERFVFFYRDVIGLQPHSIQSDFAAFSFGEVRLSVGRHSQVSGAAKDPYRVMINLGTDDIQADYRRLKEKGVLFLRPPEQERWGGWVATFHDPDGNILQLLEQPKPGQYLDSAH